MRQLTESDLQSISGGLTLDAWDTAGKLTALGAAIGAVGYPIVVMLQATRLSNVVGFAFFGAIHGSLRGFALGAIATIPVCLIAYQCGVEIKY